MEAIKAGLNGAVPFAGHVGVQITELEPGACSVRLPDRPDIRNHVGSQHAGALFSAGEAASGAAFVGAFAELQWVGLRRASTRLRTSAG